MQKVNIEVNINEGIYLKDPLKTDLGKRIIKNAIELLFEIGYEELNFKKLAQKAVTTEASIYRYFENKYMLLVYLTAWYWDFMLLMVMMDVRNMEDPKLRLKQTISTLVNSLNSIMTPNYIDQTKLHVVVVENAAKVYHHKNVDKLNKEGHYANYKKIVKVLSEMITAVDKTFKYPIALATNIIEHSLNNEYYLEHLPSLTDKNAVTKNARASTIEMIDYLLDRIL